MSQNSNQSWLESKNFKTSTAILDIQFSAEAHDNERITERIIMTAKTVSVGLKGNQYPKVSEMKKLNACVLKIEEGTKLLKGSNSSKTAEYANELTELKSTLNKVEKKYTREHSTSWWEWIVVFFVPYWWILLIIGVVIFLLTKLL